MIRQCPCGFATDDQLWFEAHQAGHLLKGDHHRAHDVGGLTLGELKRARRDLMVSLSLSFPDSPVRGPILAHIAAIDSEMAARTQEPP